MNYKWNHDTPSITQKYLTGLWAKIGAKLHRENLRIYGFRVAEPHHDGTPTGIYYYSCTQVIAVL